MLREKLAILRVSWVETAPSRSLPSIAIDTEAIPTRRPTPEAKTTAPLRNMKVNSANRVISIRMDLVEWERGASHHQHTSPIQSARKP